MRLGRFQLSPQVGAIVGTVLTHWTSAIEFQVEKSVSSTFWGCITSDLFQLKWWTQNRHALRQWGIAEWSGQCGLAITALENEMCDLVQTKLLADIIVQVVLTSNRFIVSIAETMVKQVDRAVYKCCSRDIKEGLTASAYTNMSIERQQPRSTRLSKIPSYSKSQRKNMWLSSPL